MGSTAEEPVLAACVLQRLPIVRTPVSQEYRKLQAEERERALSTGEIKEYPKLVRRNRGCTWGRGWCGGVRQHGLGCRASSTGPCGRN